MDIRPILSTLGRHKTAAALIALEIALSCAIVANAVFLIGNRLGRMQLPSGLAESELIHILSIGIAMDSNPGALVREDLAALRAVDGVRSVATTNQIPYSGSSWNNGVDLEPDQSRSTLEASTYFAGQGLVEALGLRLVAGRDFTLDEYQEFDAVFQASDSERSVPSAIVSRALAERLFPDGAALGESVYFFDVPTRIVGIVEHLLRPNDHVWGPEAREYTALFPIEPTSEFGNRYVLRVDPRRRTEILAAAIEALEGVNPNRIIGDETNPLAELRDAYYQQDRAMAWLLVAVCVALLVVTALGIVGLASFWVQQRTRQIGVRRALGATRGEILRYFHTENFLIATAGIMLGMALAYGINGLLMERYELARLPWQYLPLGAIALWVLGQGAVLGPALRAAAVAPAIATRNI
jgi:putative ABC transport system permease protein